jgi:hypothetical protein
VDFRATGPERGGGNLQIWYTKNGQADVGTSSIYTVGKFDGLVLVIDQYVGSVSPSDFSAPSSPAKYSLRVASSAAS